MPKTMKEANQRAVFSLIMFGDWATQDEFDEQLDRLAEYQKDISDGVSCYYEGLAT